MLRQKNLNKIFALLFLLVALAACDGEGCIEPDEFDNQYVKVNSNPVDDGIYGSYDHQVGGQTAGWHETGLTSNGQGFILHVAGKWVPWNGAAFTQNALGNLPRCNFCAKKNNRAADNCICYSTAGPQPEIQQNGLPASTCTEEEQDNPTKCTCTKKNGRATDYGVFHFPLTYYNKDHTLKLPDEQGDVCKYDRGMGLYLGLFGRSGGDMPIRVYHLFSEVMICPITLNSQGQCIDRDGNDRSKYLFRSANNRIFVKDDQAGNDGTDTNPADDIYHQPNEYVKLIIQDRFYSDNYGGYDVTFLQGVQRDGDTGLLEYLVRTVENSLLGENDESGVRRGSVLEYMYKAIIQDSYFAVTVQVCLSLYIAIFGVAVTLGLADITKKELMSRVMKIGLVIFFVSPNSWYWYNKLIVTWFKDGMDFMVHWLTDLGNANIDENAAIRIAQMTKDMPGSSSSRFAYIDILIKTLLSDNVTKKIWGLLLQSIFGILYIVGIYCLIGYFIYVMLTAASVYIVNLIKMVFVLSLGPIFIVFTLFGQTKDMFNKWLAFVGARTLEIILLFLVLYTMVMLIDRKFNDLFSYRVCYEWLTIGKFSLFSILKAQTSRGLVDWVHDMAVIAGLIYMLQLLMDQIPQLSGALINIGGEAGGTSTDQGKGQTSSSMKLAGAAMSTARGLISDGVKGALTVGGGNVYSAARAASRASGLSGLIDSAGDKIPFRGVKARIRDSIIDKAISEGKKAAAANGLKPGTKAYDDAVRSFAMSDKKAGLRAWQHNNPNKNTLYDMTQANIDKRLEHHLVKEPLKKQIKETAKKLKNLPANQIPLGKDMHAAIKAQVRDWAEKNLSGGAASIDQHLHNMKGLIEDSSRMSSTQAAKAFAGNEDLKNKYMQHLQDRKMEENKKYESSWLKKLENSVRKDAFGLDNIRDAKNRLFRNDAKSVAENFARRVGYKEKEGKGLLDYLGINTGKGAGVMSRIHALDINRDKFARQAVDAQGKAARAYLTKGGTMNEKDKLKDYYNKKTSSLEEGFYKRQLNKKNQEKQEGIDKKRIGHKQSLADKIKQDMEEKTKGMDNKSKEWKDLEKQMRAEYETMKQRHMEEQRNAVGYPDRTKNFGGIENYRDGLIDFEGNTLFEAAKRLEFMSGRGYSHTGSSTSQNALEELHQNEQAALDRVKNAEQALQNGNIDGAKAIIEDMKSQSVLPQGFEYKFGASIGDAMGLQASSITPQGGSVLLGSSAQPQPIDAAMIMTCESEKAHHNITVRMKKMDKMIKEHEMNKETDPKKKADLQKEIHELETDIAFSERKIDSIDSQIKTLKSV